MHETSLTSGELEILIDGLTDDVAFVWILIHLGLREDPPGDDRLPDAAVIATAFAHLNRLRRRGLIEIGRIAYADPNQQPGSLGPVKHFAEPTTVVRQRVEKACRVERNDRGWEFSCWSVNTEAGDDRARRHLATRENN